MLSRLSWDEQKKQLEGGPKLILGLTGQKSAPFCYPYGHTHTYNENTISLLKEAGHTVSFNTVRRQIVFSEEEPFALPRFDTKDLPPFADGI